VDAHRVDAGARERRELPDHGVDLRDGERHTLSPASRKGSGRPEAAAALERKRKAQPYFLPLPFFVVFFFAAGFFVFFFAAIVFPPRNSPFDVGGTR
jgi:hypothetical protein